MKLIKYLMAAGLLSMIFLSCKKEHPIPTLKFSEDLLPYVVINNSELLYKDSATGLIDSISAASQFGTIYVPPFNYNVVSHPAYNTEYCNLELTKFSGPAHSVWFKASGYPIYNSNNNNVESSADTFGISMQEENGLTAFYLPHSVSPTFSIIVEGILYDQVVIITDEQGGPDINDPNYIKTINYWAKGKGIIKRTIIKTGAVVQTYTVL